MEKINKLAACPPPVKTWCGGKLARRVIFGLVRAPAQPPQLLFMISK